MESLGYKQKNKMVYQMIENMKAKSIDFDQFLDMMTARIVSGHDTRKRQRPRPPLAARLGSARSQGERGGVTTWEECVAPNNDSHGAVCRANK